MLRLLAGLLAVLLALIAIALVAFVVEASGLPRCEDRQAVADSDADECIEGSSGEKAIGLILAGAAAALAALGAVAGVGYVRHRQGGLRSVACALATPVLAFGSLLFLPISF